MVVKFKETKTPEGERLKKALEEIQKLEVFVGFQAGEAKSEDGVDVATYAAFNEIGTSSVPPRPFMRQSVDDNADRIQAFQERCIRQLVNGKSPETVLRQIGVFQKGLVQDEITDGSFTPNSPATIRRKGSDKPLIDHGTMRKSVNYQIGKKGDFE